MYKIISMIALTLLVACSAGRSSSPSIITIPSSSVVVSTPVSGGNLNVSYYLAQSINPDGNVSTPLTQDAPWNYMRKDYGLFIARETFRRNDGQFETIWMAPPFKGFVSSNGDGGEVYQIQNGVVYIRGTQDGGKPGVFQQFYSLWPLFDSNVPPCSSGWETIGNNVFATKACHMTLTFPATGVPGNKITADSVITQHGIGSVEQIVFAKGWGQLYWSGWKTIGNCSWSTPPLTVQLTPSISGMPTPAGQLCDIRLNTNIVKADGKLSGTKFGWLP